MHYKLFIFISLFFFLINKPLSVKEYISIKEVTTKANLRAGPGIWYPIKWVIKTPSLPLKLIEKNDSYYKVELHDGTKGWIAKTLISKKSNLIVVKDALISNKKGKVKAKVLKDFIIKDYNCFDLKNENYCNIKIGRIKGFIKKTNIWGHN